MFTVGIVQNLDALARAEGWRRTGRRRLWILYTFWSAKTVDQGLTAGPASPRIGVRRGVTPRWRGSLTNVAPPAARQGGMQAWGQPLQGAPGLLPASRSRGAARGALRGRHPDLLVMGRVEMPQRQGEKPELRLNPNLSLPGPLSRRERGGGRQSMTGSARGPVGSRCCRPARAGSSPPVGWLRSSPAPRGDRSPPAVPWSRRRDRR